MKLNSAFFYSLLTFSMSILIMNTDVWAKNQKDTAPERWFEIEVILFKQLGNKAELKEHFPTDINASNLPHYKESFDLLTSYLQPNLSNIKRFMPLCGKQNEQHLFLESLQNINTPFPEQIQSLEKVSIFDKLEFMENQQTTVNEAQHEQVNLVTFEFDLQKEDLTKAIFSTEKLCIISPQEMANILNEEQLAHFNIDSFGVDALPTRLDASGRHNSAHPYLIADESLLLKDISQNLRWSREFQPLLHFGWRQVGITEKEAIPVKLLAGEHIEYQYQQALIDYQTEVKEANAIENNLLEQIMQNQVPVDDEFKINLVQKQQALSQLFSRIDAMEKSTANKLVKTRDNGDITSLSIDKDTISDIVSRINKQDINSLLAQHNTDTSHEHQSSEPNNRPKAPLQPWFLDGFFKVHLDHYLYITADFNLFNQVPTASYVENSAINTLKTEQTKSNTDYQADEIKLINFSQTRRVITGEVHYFDHPYIGMIVQIRRFDPTQPKGERVSQAIR